MTPTFTALRRLVPAALWAACSLAAAAGAQAKVQYSNEDWGTGGLVKSGLWSVLYLELKSADEDFAGVLEVEANADQRVLPLFRKPVSLVRDTLARQWVYFRTPSTSFPRSYRFTWRLLDRRGRTVLENEWQRARTGESVVLPAQDSLVGVLRSADVGRAGIGALTDPKSHLRTHVVMLTPQWAPDRVIGYEGLDALVWLDPDPAALPTPAQIEAITNYVRQGGHLVLAAGVNWQALTGSFLADLLPAQPTGSDLAPDLPALETFGVQGRAAKSLVLLRLEGVFGDVLLERAGRPVVVRDRVGLGRVTLIGFDPTRASMPGAEDAAPFWRAFWGKMLDLDAVSLPQEQLGSLNLVSDSLVRPLDDFPGFKPINFLFVAFFLVLYVVLIGPIDYFVLKHLKKLHWTWVTFPSVAVGSSLIAFFLLSSGRVTGLLSNSISLVDASLEGREMAGTTFMTVLSPRQARYTVSLEPGATGAVVPIEYRGTAGASGPLALDRSSCQVLGAGERLENLLIRVWDANTVEAAWRAAAADLPDVELTAGPGGLTGRIKNTTRDVLQRAVLFYGARALHLDDIRPGETRALGAQPWSPANDFVNRNVPPGNVPGPRTFEMQEMAYHREDAERAARWVSFYHLPARPEDTGRFRRWRVLGESYQTAAFDLAARADLAGLPTARQAVLVYSLDRALVQVRLEGERPQTSDTTVVRLRIPVTPASDTRRPAGQTQSAPRKDQHPTFNIQRPTFKDGRESRIHHPESRMPQSARYPAWLSSLDVGCCMLDVQCSSLSRSEGL